jgi:hypothetical protein
MPDVNVYEAFKELIQRLLGGDEELAELVATDPEGALSAFGVTDGDLSGVDFRQAVDECYHDYDLTDSGKQALESYVAGGEPPAHFQVKAPPAADGHHGPEQAVQHLQYVTYATYESNETVTREIINKQFTIDNSDNRVFNVDNSTAIGIDVGRDFDGDITVANTTATGDGAIIGDENIVNDGDGDILNATRGSEINAATGDGAVQGERVEGVNTGEFEGALAGRDVDGPTNTGRFDGVQAGDEVSGTVNTGENTGVIANGDVEGTVAGDGNQTANLDINTSGGSSGGAGGAGGDGRGGLNDSRNDLFDTRDSGIDGSGVGGDGIGGTSGDGGSGDVGPINLNFGSGDQTNTGDVQDSAVASGGNATNDQSVRERLEAEQAEDLPPVFEETDVEILPVPGPGGQLGQEIGQELNDLEEIATDASQADEASLGV